MVELDLGSYGITVPASYRVMSAAGLLSYGASREDWQANWKTLLVSAPPALAWLDLEWLSTEAIVERAARTKGRSDWREQWGAFPFVAFAETGAGDEFGWAPSLADGATEAPVVYIEHDTEDASIVAPAFAGFVFRLSLQGLAAIRPRKEMTSLEESIASVVASVRGVLPHLEPPQKMALEQTVKTPLRERISHRLREVDGKLVRDEKIDSHSYGYGLERGAYEKARAILDYRRFDEKLPYDVTPT
jgi:hypothetical protein